MELFHLRYFVAVASELNFTRAAAKLHMATSPLSQRIKDLERDLGCDLFVRSHRQLRLTDEGEALLPLAEDVIRRFDRLADAVHPKTRGHRRARIGIAPDVAGRTREALLTALHSAHPEIDVELHPASTAPLTRAVVAGELELALVHGPVARRGIRSVRLRTDPVGVAIASGAGFDDRESVRLEELTELAYASVNPETAPELYHRTEQVLTRAGVNRRVAVEGDNLAGLAHLVAGGRVFALVSLAGGATYRAFAGEPVVILRVEEVRLQVTTEAIWREGRDVEGDVVADLVATVTAGLVPG
ncbi:MAG TPA: LysR family transcriptional regulator [Solirubrobacteraceae bacterium]